MSIFKTIRKWFRPEPRTPAIKRYAEPYEFVPFDPDTQWFAPNPAIPAETSSALLPSSPAETQDTLSLANVDLLGTKPNRDHRAELFPGVSMVDAKGQDAKGKPKSKEKKPRVQGRARKRVTKADVQRVAKKAGAKKLSR